MLTSISLTSSIVGLINVIIIIILAVITLNKFTDEQLLRRSGALLITVSTVSLLIILIGLIAASIGLPFGIRANADAAPLPIRLLYNIAGLAIGIVVFKSGFGISALAFGAAGIAAVFSLAKLFFFHSFASGLTFFFAMIAVATMLRQFREKRRRSK